MPPRPAPSAAANLDQIGIALFQYMDLQGQSGTFPDAADTPTVTPNKPPIWKLLGPFIEINKASLTAGTTGGAAFQCPADNGLSLVSAGTSGTTTSGTTGSTPATFQGRYYPVQGLSYEYPNLAVAGKTCLQVLNGQPSETVYILYDFDCFHGPAGSNGSRTIFTSTDTRIIDAPLQPASPGARERNRAGDQFMGKRTVIIAVCVLLLGGGTAWALLHRKSTSKVQEKLQELQATMTADNGPPGDRRKQFRKVMEDLTPAEGEEMRQQMFENFRKRQEEHDRQYCALTPAEKAAFLEKEIAEQERRRQEREAELRQGGGGGPGGNASGNSSGGQGTTDTSGGSAGQGGRPNFRSMTADQRLQMRKQMLDRTTPEARAQHGVYVNDMNNARAAQGLPPIRGGGFGFGGGGPPR